MSFPKHIPPRHVPAVIALLQGYLAIKNEPPPEARLHPRDRERLFGECIGRAGWRRVLHWKPMEKFMNKNKFG